MLKTGFIIITILLTLLPVFGQPKTGDEWYKEGMTLYKEMKIEHAKKCFNEAVKVSPESKYSWYYKGTKETDKVKKDLNKDYTGDISIDFLSPAGEWAMVWFTVKEKTETTDNCYLIKQYDGKWGLVMDTNDDVTTDFLEAIGVPTDKWTALLGEYSVEKNSPLLDYLHKAVPDHYFMGIRYADKWAIVSMREIKEEMGPVKMGLAKYENKSWKLITSGDTLNKKQLIKAGVSSDCADVLLSK